MPAAAADPDVEHVERVDERDQLAARGRRRHHLQERGSCGPTIADRRARTAGRAETRRPSRASKAVMPVGASADSSPGSIGGSAVVSVRSSWRARRSDSRSARARAMYFRLIFAFRRTIRAGPGARSSDVRYATSFSGAKAVRCICLHSSISIRTDRRFGRIRPSSNHRPRRTRHRRRSVARRAHAAADARGVHLPRFPRPVVRRLHLEHRHLDADRRPELDGRR